MARRLTTKCIQEIPGSNPGAIGCFPSSAGYFLKIPGGISLEDLLWGGGYIMYYIAITGVRTLFILDRVALIIGILKWYV